VISLYTSFEEIKKYIEAIKVLEQVPFGDIVNFFASGKDLGVFYQPEIDRIVEFGKFISSIPELKANITADFLAGKLVSTTIINSII
jgi:hypothetical protein